VRKDSSGSRRELPVFGRRILVGGVIAAHTLSCAAAAADLHGRLRNGSTADGVVPSFEVRLTGRLANGERVDRRATTDHEGAFRFEAVEGDTADVYVLSTNFHGIDYLSPFIKYSLGQNEHEQDLIVHDATDDVNVLAVMGHHYIVECQPDAKQVMITEVLAISNGSTKTFHSHTPLSFPVPPGATEIAPLDGFEAGFPEDGALKLSAVVRPGGLEGAFRYFLPARFPLVLPLQVSMPTEELTVLVSPPDTKVQGRDAELSSMGTVDLGGVIAERYGVAATGGTASILLEAPKPAAFAPVLIVVALAFVFAGAILAHDRAAHPRTKARSVDPRLVAERDRYLQELLALERRGASGEIAHDALQRERDRLFAKAGAVQELLDTAPERTR